MNYDENAQNLDVNHVEDLNNDKEQKASVLKIEQSYKARQKRKQETEFNNLKAQAQGLHQTDFVNDIALPHLKDHTSLLNKPTRPDEVKFAKPDLVNVQELKDDNLVQAAKFCQKRFKDAENFKMKLIADIEQLNNQRTSLQGLQFYDYSEKQNVGQNEFNSFYQDQKARMHVILKEIAKAYESIQKSITAKSSAHKKRFHNSNQILELNGDLKNLIIEKNAKVKELNFNELNQIQIPDIHNKMNDVFLWVFECVYKEQQANYWWDNFRHQVFQQDKGQDYQQRLLGIDISNIEDQEGHLTQNLLNEQQVILETFQNSSNKQNPSFLKHFEIAANVLKLYKKHQHKHKLMKENSCLEVQEVKLKLKIDLAQEQLTGLLEAYSAINACQKAFDTFNEFIFAKQENTLKKSLSLTMNLQNKAKRLKKWAKSMNIDEGDTFPQQIERTESQILQPYQPNKFKQKAGKRNVKSGRKSASIKVDVDNTGQQTEPSDCKCRVF